MSVVVLLPLQSLHYHPSSIPALYPRQGHWGWCLTQRRGGGLSLQDASPSQNWHSRRMTRTRSHWMHTDKPNKSICLGWGKKIKCPENKINIDPGRIYELHTQKKSQSHIQTFLSVIFSFNPDVLWWWAGHACPVWQFIFQIFFPKIPWSVCLYQALLLFITVFSGPNSLGAVNYNIDLTFT